MNIENFFKSLNLKVEFTDKYLIETFPNMKTQVLIDILSFAVKNEYDEYCDDELDNFIFNIYEYN